MTALHLDEPVPCWLTSMPYWHFKRKQAITNVISYTFASPAICLLYVPWICITLIYCDLKAQKKGEKQHACHLAAVLLSCLCLFLHFHPPPAVRMSVGLFALPDVSWQEEAACLSSVSTSNSHVDGLSQLPFLRSLKVSLSSLHAQASATIPPTERRLDEPLVKISAVTREGRGCRYVCHSLI